MANKVDAKLTDISNKRTAKVNAIRELETKLRKSGITDAERKSLNTELNKLNSERTKLEADYNKFAKVAKTAKEYVKLNDELKKLQSSIAQAEARGESTASYKSSRTGVIQRLNQISSEVESVFPEIKVARAVLTTTLSAKSTGPTGTPTGPTGPTGTPAGKPTGTPADKPTGTPADKPTGTPAGPTGTPETIVDREAEALNEAAKADFALPETLFKNIPSLAALLKKYVSTPGMTPDAFRKMLRDDVWYKQNSKEIKERFVQYYNFRELQASGRAQGTTDYEMQIAKIEASLKKRAVEIGSAAASDPAALRKAAENLYITNRSEDNSFIDDFLAASIRTISGTIGGRVTEGYSGQALTNYQTLLSTARDNGLKISDIIPGGSNEQQVLQGLASGKIDINRIISDTRKLAAQGQPTYVRDLLSQGYNLNQVYAPYRQTMAAVLEIDDPNSIDLNDPLLRSAISDKGDMNIYDFTRALRKDDRWQYTKTAKDEVSTAALGVLRDFGFQG